MKGHPVHPEAGQGQQAAGCAVLAEQQNGLGAWMPEQSPGAELAQQPARLLDQRQQLGIADLPAPAHLFNHQLGV